MHTRGVEEALVVTTRSRVKKEKEQENLRVLKEASSGADPKPLELPAKTVSGECKSSEAVVSVSGDPTARSCDVSGTSMGGAGDGVGVERVEDNVEEGVEDGDLGNEFDFSEAIFPDKTVKERKTQRQKRGERQSHGLERAKDKPKQKSCGEEELMSRESLLQLQATDETLRAACKMR